MRMFKTIMENLKTLEKSRVFNFPHNGIGSVKVVIKEGNNYKM